MNKTVFEYQGARYESLNEIAEIRGVKKVNRRDFDRLGITEVEVQDAPAAVTPVLETAKAPEAPATPEPKNEQPEPPKDDATKAGDKKNNPNPPSEPKAEEQPKADAAALAKAETLQKKYGYTNVNDLGAALKKMPDGAAVVTLAKEIGVTWKEDTHPGINRMRAAMAIRTAMFPGERRERAPKSGWKSTNLEELLKLAKKHKLKYRETIDEKITRMWVIKALNDAGIAPPQ